MRQPLAGLRVLDLSRLLPGPLATLHLADLGAEVIKLESPGKADYLRFLEPYVKGQNVGFSTLNRGKKSVLVAFETPEGGQLVKDLVATCDVVVESFRAGYLKRFGLDYESLAQQNPNLVYCSITAFGQNSSRAGHDLNCLALAGLTHALANGAEPSVPHTQLADVTCGLAASQAILAALYAKEKGRGGAHLDVAMTDAAYHLVMLDSASARAEVESFHAGMLSGSMPFYRYYRCSDGKYLAVGSVEDKFRDSVLEALGVERWDQAEEVFLGKSQTEWAELLAPLDACVEPVLTPQEVLDADWMKERFGQWENPPGLLEASFGRATQDCALPGEHTAEVLGLTPEQSESLTCQGIVVQAS
jgi:alpha-methylacyl-CoA racemase